MNPPSSKLSLQTLVIFGIVAIVLLPDVVVGGVLQLESLVTPKFFNDIIGQASPSCRGKHFYTRAAFLTAAKSFPSFANGPTVLASKREIAAFFAHVTHETGYFCHIEEIEKNKYCSGGCPKYPCKVGKWYYSRGAIPITGNCNYGAGGAYLGLDLVNHPELIATDPTVSFKAALWFWNTNVRPVQAKGFGATIRVVDPGECNGRRPNAVTNRIALYKKYCSQFGITPGVNLSC